MSELLTRSVYQPARSETVPVTFLGDDAVLGSFAYKTLPYQLSFEAITPNSKTVRRRVAKSAELQTDRELLVEVDRNVVQNLAMWKPFQHYKRWVDSTDWIPGSSQPEVGYTTLAPFPESLVAVNLKRVDDVDYEWVFGGPGKQNLDLPVWFDEETEMGEWIPSPDNLDELVSRSLKTLMPNVRTQVQLWNSLWELKDLGTVRRTISRIKQFGHSLSFKGVVGSLRDASISAADVFLQWNFNVKPLISDIEGIHKALTRSFKRFRRLLQHDGTPQVTYFRTSFDEYDPIAFDSEQTVLFLRNATPSLVIQGGTAFFNQQLVNATVRRTVSYEKSAFYAQLRFIARWSDSQHRYAEQLSLIDALGLSFNPKHIWDAIPWSFVVDWVVKVGDFLDKFRQGALDPVLDVLDYSWSIKRRRKIFVSVDYYSPLGIEGSIHPVRNTVDYPVVNESAYRRQPVQLDKNALLLSGFSSRELRLASALLITRKRKLEKPKVKGRRIKFRRPSRLKSAK